MGADFLQASGPRLSLAEECRLGRQAKRSRKARHELITRNIPLAVQIARRYWNGDPDDLVSEAMIGLDDASRKFDPTRGRFAKVASFYIKNRIRRYLNIVGNGMKIPAHFNDRMHVVDELIAEMEPKLGRAPTDAEIAKKCGLNEKAVAFQRAGYARVISMQAPKGDNGDVAETLADPQAPHPGDAADISTLAATLKRAMSGLNKRERTIVSRRFGLKGASVTLDVLGEQYGISRERVRQIERDALLKMRVAIDTEDAWIGGSPARAPYAHPQRQCPHCFRVIVNGDTHTCQKSVAFILKPSKPAVTKIK